MRILQAGNANFGYVLAKELRKRGIEADLLVSRQAVSGQNFSINDPKSHDFDIDSYPDWVIFYDRTKKTKLFEILQMMKKYDLICAYNTLPSYAMLSGKPYIAVTGGDDLRKKAFEKSITGYLLQRAYKKADMLVYVWPVAKPYLEKLGLNNTQFIPRIWDLGNFANKLTCNQNTTLNIFMPTAQLWGLKGNDKFLRAFARLCKERKDIHLYYVDWGKDSQKAKQILSKPDIAKYTTIIPGPIPRKDMILYMSKSDILVDQFNTGSFTRIGIEAFSFGIPILINLDESLYRQAHGDLPSVLQCSTEDEIYERISWSLENKNKLYEMAANSQRWVARHFDLQKNIDKYVELYQKILKK